MHKVRLLLISLLLLIPCTSMADPNEDLKSYVQTLLKESYDLFHDDSLTKSEKKIKSARIIRSHLYLDWMAKQALGRNRLTMPPEKLNEFIKVYSDFVVMAYSDLVANYSGESAVLLNVKPVNDELFLVNTEVRDTTGKPPTRINYLVHKLPDSKATGKFLVGDIIAEGISILNSQQSEFNSVILSRGIDSLISDLKKRTNITQ